ncbi:glycoside hydrolase family 19 protein, partial [Pseudomonas aeruginosa]
MTITEQNLLQILQYAGPRAGVFVWARNRALACLGMAPPVSAAAFLAQVGHESGQLTRLVENLNYSARGLAATWPSRYLGADSQPNALA